MANEKKIDMKMVVASPVLTGKDSKYIWTGVVSSENIEKYEYIIPDSRKRRVFKKLVEEYEKLVFAYRNNGKINNTPMASFTHAVRTEIDKNKLEMEIRAMAEEIKEALNNPAVSGIDMGLFWIHLCREYEMINEKNPNEFKAMSSEARKNLKLFIDTMNTSEPLQREYFDCEKNKYKTHLFLTLSQEKRYAKKTNIGVDALKKLVSLIEGKEDVTDAEFISVIKEISERITLMDLNIILQNKRFSEMQYISAFKNFLITQGYTAEQIAELSNEDLRDKAQILLKSDKKAANTQLIAGCILDSAQYVDTEKLMLFYMCRSFDLLDAMAPEKGFIENTRYGQKSLDEMAEKAKETIDTEKYDYDGNTLIEAVERMRRTEEICKRVIKEGIVNKRSSATIIFGNISETHNFKRIEAGMKKFCDGIYLTYTTQLNLLYNAYENPSEIESWSDELIQRVEFSEDDLLALGLMNFENFKRFYSLGKLRKDMIKNFFIDVQNGEFDKSIEEAFIDNDDLREQARKNKELLFGNLYLNGYIDEIDIKDYFRQAVITKEMLDDLETKMTDEEKEEHKIKMQKVFDKEELLIRYKAYAEKYVEFIKYQESNPDELEKIENLRKEINFLRSEKERYREIFNKFNQIPENEKIEFGDSLLADYYIEMEVSDEAILSESLKVLYEDGFIGLENIVHMDNSYIIPILDKLSMEDTKKVRNSMSKENLEEMLDKIFDDKEFSDERKFIIIMNMFDEDSKEDTEAREFYLSLLEFEDSEKRKSKKKSTRQKTGKGGSDSNRYVYKDNVKWKFYKALDKDVRARRYANGFVEFASTKLGVRIIEKYYDGDKPAYGVATYILTEEEFRRNQSDLVTISKNGNEIMESAVLREIVPRTDRIAHRTQSEDKTWMDEMVKYFSDKISSRYEKKEIEQLQDTVQKYKTDYEMIL